MAALPYLLVYTLPPITLYGLWRGGAWTLLGLVFVFGVIPLLDALSGLDTAEPGEAPRPWAFNLVVRAWLPVQLGVIGYGAWRAAEGMSALEWIGAALSVGVTASAAGITIAHELMHRRAKLDRALAEALMTSTTYTHFCVEHILGHHKRVATPEDPASARAGQSLYAFLPQTLVGSLRSAWALEGRRAARRGLARTLRDRRLRYVLDVLAAYGVVFALLGGPGVAFFAAQSAVAILLLELINYIEHYGLTRREIAPGRYERVTPWHSWSSAHRLTRRFLFGLPRHADHHAHAARPYWALRHVDDAPQHPMGYGAMVLLSLAPPLWFWVMNPRLEAWREAVEAEA